MKKSNTRLMYYFPPHDSQPVSNVLKFDGVQRPFVEGRNQEIIPWLFGIVLVLCATTMFHSITILVMKSRIETLENRLATFDSIPDATMIVSTDRP